MPNIGQRIFQRIHFAVDDIPVVTKGKGYGHLHHVGSVKGDSDGVDFMRGHIIYFQPTLMTIRLGRYKYDYYRIATPHCYFLVWYAMNDARLHAMYTGAKAFVTQSKMESFNEPAAVLPFPNVVTTGNVCHKFHFHGRLEGVIDASRKCVLEYWGSPFTVECINSHHEYGRIPRELSPDPLYDEDEIDPNDDPDGIEYDALSFLTKLRDLTKKSGPEGVMNLEWVRDKETSLMDQIRI